MNTALVRAFLQMVDPAIRRVVWISALATALALLSVTFAASSLLAIKHVTGLPWLDPLVDVLGSIAFFGVAVAAAPLLLPGVSSLFLDDVVTAVERRHYPSIRSSRVQPLFEIVGMSLRFITISVALNLLVLPFYLVPGLNIVVFFGVNGALLGRNYYEQVASRHLDPVMMAALRRHHRPQLLCAGVIIGGLATIPVVNLLVPVLATAYMVHIFHSLSAPRGTTTRGLP